MPQVFPIYENIHIRNISSRETKEAFKEFSIIMSNRKALEDKIIIRDRNTLEALCIYDISDYTWWRHFGNENEIICCVDANPDKDSMERLITYYPDYYSTVYNQQTIYSLNKNLENLGCRRVWILSGRANDVRNAWCFKQNTPAVQKYLIKAKKVNADTDIRQKQKAAKMKMITPILESEDINYIPVILKSGGTPRIAFTNLKFGTKLYPVRGVYVGASNPKFMEATADYLELIRNINTLTQGYLDKYNIKTPN